MYASVSYSCDWSCTLPCYQYIMLFKFLNRLIHIPTRYLPAPFPLKHHQNKSRSKAYARMNRYHYSFLPRTILDWNNLCSVGDLANCNLDYFKQYLLTSS